MAVVVLAALGLPAIASATDRYVDAETGADSNSACPQANPCLTITYALAGSAASDTIRIDNGNYNENLTLGGGRSLRYTDFVAGDGSVPATIDGVGGTAVTVSTAAGTIHGLRLRGDTTGVLLNAPAEIDSAIFDDPNALSATAVWANFGAAGCSVHDSQFSDPAPSTSRGRVGLVVSDACTVSSNTFTGFNRALSASTLSAGDTVVTGNTVTGSHNLPYQGLGILAQEYDVAEYGDVIVRNNEVKSGSGTVNGIEVSGPASLVRNNVHGQYIGVVVDADSTGVTLEGDRIWGNTQDALWLHDNGTTAPAASVTATNVTLAGDVALRNDYSVLTLDSSIVSGAISSTGTASCTITYSNGPAPSGDIGTSGCYTYQSNADPKFVDAATGNLHLMATSPLIDVGNPAAPAVGAVDFDGDARAIDGADACPAAVRRDIGADEYAPAQAIDCDPPDTQITSSEVADGGITNNPTPTFMFSSNEAGATFECKLDLGSFGLCSHTTQHIADLTSSPDGNHQFSVRAKDTYGNIDPTPAVITFALDRVATDTTITAKPPRRTTARRVTFKFSNLEPATFKCKLDSKPYVTCSSPFRVRIGLGKHTLLVRATDEAGNVEVAPAKATFKRIKKR